MDTKTDYGMCELGTIHEPVVLTTFLISVPLLWKVLDCKVPN